MQGITPIVSKFKTLIKYNFVFLALLLLSNNGWGQIYLNTFTGASACPTNGNTPNMAANSTGTAVTRSTVICNATASVFNSTTLNVTNSISNTSYIEFSATANTGFILNLTSVSFFRQGSNSAPNQIEVRYSTDGFSTSTTWGSAPITPTTGTNATWDFTDFSTGSGGIVTFRIYPYGTTRCDNATGASTTGTFRVDDVTIYGTVTSSTTPTITGAASATAFTTTYGTASSPQSFSISGSNLTANLIATAPTGFEVSSNGSSYGGTATFTQTSGSASGTLYIRLAATAAVGAYNNQNIVLSSTGATSVNIATASSGNAVSAKTLTISGLSAANKTYDGTTTVSVTGTPAYSGLVNSESFLVSGTVTFAFATASVGTGKTINNTGTYSAPSSNYTVTQPTLTANITAIQLNAPTITGITGGNSTLSVSFTAPSNANSTGAAISNYKYSIDGGSTFTAFLPVQTTSPLSITSGLTNGTTYNVQIMAINSYGDGIASSTMQGTPIANSTVNASASLTAFTTTYGTASSSQSFAVSGSYLSADVIATAPSGYEVSSDGISYGATATFTQSSGNASGTLYIRLKTTAIVGTYNSLNIAFTSTGASTVNVSTTASGNTVSAKGLTITGLTATNKTYDGTTSVSVTGTPSYSGLVNGESFAISGSSTWAFATKTVGTSKSITQTGSYTAPSSNYTVTQPTLTADITAATLTISSPSVTTKTYDGSTTATITGTLSGIISPDVVTLVGTGSFASANAGLGIQVTASCSLSGADAGNYILTQPTGLTGDITKANQTITFGTLTNKYTTDAPFALTATTTSALTISYISSNTAVATVAGNTVTIVGAGTTTITASQIGDNNYNAATSVNQSLTVLQPDLVEVVFPQYAINGTNTASRLQYVCRLQINNLNANATYRYTTQGVNNGNAGNMFVINNNSGSSGYVTGYSSGKSLSGSLMSVNEFASTNRYGEFTTDNNGSYNGWFSIVPTSNSVFTVGQSINFAIVLNDGNNGTTASKTLTSSSTITMLAPSNGSNGSQAIKSLSVVGNEQMVFLYDNISGNGRPITGNWTEDDGITTSMTTWYETGVTGSGSWGSYIPLSLNNGIRRIEYRKTTDNSLIYAITDQDGNWGGSVNTVNPTGGTTALVLPQTFDDLIINSNVTLSAATSVYGTVTVNSGATLTTAGYLTLKSNATATARIAQSAGSISGDVNVERYIPQNSNRAWRTLSVPTYGSQSIASSWKLGTLITGPASCTDMDAITNGYSMYTYNASTDNLVGVSSTATAINNNSVNPAAYFLYVRGDRNTGIANSNANPSATTLSTTGSVYQGQVSIDISANNGSATTYHLIGNPYVSPININSFLINANNANNIENYIYVWDPKMTNTANGVGGILTLTSNGSGYDPTTTGLSYSNGTTELPSGMAFFVQKKSSNCTTCSLVFTESMKSSGATTPNGFKTTSGLDGRMQINLEVKINDSTQGIADGLLALYDAQADMQVSTSEDALKMSNFGENMSIRNGTNLLAIEKRPLRTIDTLAIQTDGLLNRAYTLVFNPSQFDAGVKAQLIDHYLNLTYPIATLNKTTYAFSVDANAASKASNRFELLYNNQNALIISNTLQAANIQVYPNPTDGKVNIDMHSASTGNYHAQVFNTFGASVVEQDFVNEMGNSISIDLSAQAKGVYYLKISNTQHEQVVVKIIHL